MVANSGWARSPPPEAEANRRQRTMATTEIHVGTLEGDRVLLPAATATATATAAAAVDSVNYQLIKVAAFCPSGIQMKSQPLWLVNPPTETERERERERERGFLCGAGVEFFPHAAAEEKLKVVQIWSPLCSVRAAGSRTRRLWIPPELISSSPWRPLRDVPWIISRGRGRSGPPEEPTGITVCMLVWDIRVE